MFSKSKSLLLAAFTLLIFGGLFFFSNQNKAAAGSCGAVSNQGSWVNGGEINCNDKPYVYDVWSTYKYQHKQDGSASGSGIMIFRSADKDAKVMAVRADTTSFCFVDKATVDASGNIDTGSTCPEGGELINTANASKVFPGSRGYNWCSLKETNPCVPASGEILQVAGFNQTPFNKSEWDKSHPNGPPFDEKWNLGTQVKAADANAKVEDKNNQCQNQDQAGPLGFLLCPLFDLVQTSINKITGVQNCDQGATNCTIDPNAPLMTLLIVKPLEFSGQGSTSASSSVPLQAANERVRDIAYALYIIIFLVIIFANFIDFGIDNYTIKRLLPRLVAAVILTPFSYLICAFAIDLGNTLGFAVPMIITGGTAPTNPIESALKAVAQLGAGSDVLSGLAVFGSFLIILALAIAVLISLIVALIYMLFRLLFLYLLVIVAPVAIAASVLPLTNKFFRMWGTNLIKLNLMFPLVTGLVAISGVVSATLLASANGNGFMVVAAALVPVLAFFLIPKCFKWSGELMEATAGAAAAYLGGRAGSYAKSANQAHNEKEAERRQARRQEIAAGRNRLYGGENSLARRVRAGSGIRKNKPANMVDFRAKQMAALKPWMDAAKLADNKQLEKMGSSRNPMAQRAAGEAMLNRGMAKEFLNSKANTAANIDFIKRLNPDAFKKMPMIADQKWRDNKGTDRNDWYGKLTFDKIADMSADAQQHVLIDNWSKLSPTVQAAAADRRNQGRLDPLAGAAAQAGGTAPAGYNPTNNPFNSL